MKDFHIKEKQRGGQRPNGDPPIFDGEAFNGTGYVFSKARQRLADRELMEVARKVTELRVRYRERSSLQALAEVDKLGQEEAEEFKAPAKLNRTFTKKKDRASLGKDDVAL